MQDPDAEKKILTPEEMDSLLGPKGEQRHWATVLDVQRSGIDSQIDGLKQKEALVSEIISKGPEAVLQEVAQNLQDSKTKLTKIDQWENYLNNQENIDRNFDELSKQKAWLEEEIKGRSLGGTLSATDEMMGRSKAEVISPKLAKELEDVERGLKEYLEKIPSELLKPGEYDDTTNELIKIAGEKKGQKVKENEVVTAPEAPEAPTVPLEPISPVINEQPLVQETISPIEPVIETSPPAPAVQPSEILTETSSPVQDETNTQVESKDEPELLPPTEPTFAREAAPIEADRNQGDLPDFLVSRQSASPQPADIPSVPVAPIESVSPVSPRVEEPAQPVPEAQQGPKDLLSRLKEKLSSTSEAHTDFETTPQEVVDYLKTFELPMGARVVDAKPIEEGDNYIIIEGAVDGRASGKNGFKIKLESDNDGVVSAKILGLNLSLRARMFKGKIEASLKDINKNILDKINENIDQAWKAKGFGIAGGKLSIGFLRDRYY